MTDPQGPDDPGARDECATCGHARWRHKAVDGRQVCTEYVNCACEGNFVELSYGTRMARFVQAAQHVAASIATVRDALSDTMQATAELYSAMQLAGLIPDTQEDENTEQPAGRHSAATQAVLDATEVAAQAARLRAQNADKLAAALDIPAENISHPAPDHWTQHAPIGHWSAPEPTDLETTHTIPAYHQPVHPAQPGHEHNAQCVRYGCPPEQEATSND